MRHNFIEAARRESATLPEGYERTLLDYLRFEAVGRANAKSWTQIDEHLRSRGHVVRKEHFQQGLLKRSREGDFYIGSCDNDPRGYFLIENIADADVMISWYQQRINTETTRMNALKRWVDERPVVMTPQGMVNAQQYAETYYWHQADARAANAYGVPPTDQEVVNHMTPQQRLDTLEQMQRQQIRGRDLAGTWRWIGENPQVPLTTPMTADQARQRIAEYRAANPGAFTGANPEAATAAVAQAQELMRTRVNPNDQAYVEARAAAFRQAIGVANPDYTNPATGMSAEGTVPNGEMDTPS